MSNLAHAFIPSHSTEAILSGNARNPTSVTITRQGFAQSYLILPKVRQPITIGTGFSTVAASTVVVNPFRTLESAFDLKELDSTKIAFHRNDSASGSYLSNTSTRLSSSSDHLSLNLGVGIGNDFVGASVTGSYDKSVLSNLNSARTSRRASYEAGSLHFPQTPSLSAEALQLLRDHGYGAFVQRYGDFYVSALILGGEAGIMISESHSTDSSSDQEKITAEGHFLGISAEGTVVEKHDTDARSAFEFTLTAFDSLTGDFVDLPEHKGHANAAAVFELDLTTPLMPRPELTDSDNLSNYQNGLNTKDARSLALDFDVRVQELPQRVKTQLEQLSQINPDTTRIDWDDLRMLEQTGLIFRLILVPFALHRTVRAYAVKASIQ